MAENVGKKSQSDSHPIEAATFTSKQADPEWQDYIRVLERDGRDIDGKLLKRGARVLCHPSQPEAVREDSSANRQEFLRQDRSWTPRTRQRIWFPAITSVPDNLMAQAERCRSAKNVFLAAISENIALARQQPIPEVKSLPFWFAILAWEPKIKKVIEVADLTGQLVDRLIEMSCVPRDVAWPEDWRQWLSNLNVMKVYALGGMTATVHVIATLPSSIRFKLPGSLEFLPAGEEMIDLVYEVYQQWSHGTGSRVSFSFFTLASAFTWPEQIAGHSAGDHWLVVSSLKANGTFETRTPTRSADRLSLRNFMDRLKPETRQQRISKIREFVDELLESGYDGYIHMEKIARETGYRRTAVKEALLALLDSGHYRIYKTSKTSGGKIAIGTRSLKIGATITAASFRQSWLARLAWLGPAFTVGIWSAKDLILGQHIEIWNFAVMIPLAYAGEWLNTRFRKWHKDKE